jgi:hypothetical protein
VVRTIASVTLEAADPARMAARWAEVLGLGAPRRTDTAFELALAPGLIRFVAAGARGEGLSAVGLTAADANRALAIARERGLSTEGRSVEIGGVRFDLE